MHCVPSRCMPLHMAAYGTQTTQWEKAAKMLLTQESPSDSTFLFPCVNLAKLKSRFSQWMEFIGKQRAKAVKDSGTDDELSNMYTQYAAMEAIYDEHKDQEENKTNKSNAEAQKAMIDKAAAEVLKCKASGTEIPEHIVAQFSKASDGAKSSEDGSESANGKRASLITCLTATKKRKDDATIDKLSGLAASQAQRNQMAILKEQRVARQFDLREKQMVHAAEIRDFALKEKAARRTQKVDLDKEKVQLEREKMRIEEKRLANEAVRLEMEKKKTDIASEQHAATIQAQTTMLSFLKQMMDENKRK